MACLSAALSYAVESGRVRTNVAKDVTRPSRSKRMRLISDSEYLTVYRHCSESLRLAMTFAVRTLALPDDLLGFGLRNIMKLQDGRRIELAKAIDEFLGRPVIYETFVHTCDGEGTVNLTNVYSHIPHFDAEWLASLSRCTRLPRLFRTRKRLTFPIRSGCFGSFAVNLTVPGNVLITPCSVSVVKIRLLAADRDWVGS